MAPKPSGKTSPKKPTPGANTPKPGKDAAKSGKDESETVSHDDGPATFEAPKSIDEALQQIDFEGLPTTDTEAVISLLRKKCDDIVKIFAHYSKVSEWRTPSGVIDYGVAKTVELACRMRLSGFKKLIKEAGLELKVYDIGQMSRLFNLKGGAKVRTRTLPCPPHMRHTRTLRGKVAERRDQRAEPTAASSPAVPGSSAGGRGHLKTVAFHRGRVSVGSSRAQLERSPYARAPWPRPRVAAGLTTARPSPSLGRARRCGGCPGWRLGAPGLGHGDGLGHARRERTYALSGRGALRELADPLSCWGRVVLALWRATC